MDDAYAAYVILTLPLHLRVFTPTKALADASSAASPWSTSAAWGGIVPSPPEASGAHNVSESGLTTII